MTGARRVSELTRAERTRAIVTTVLRFVAVSSAIIAVYYFLPLDASRVGAGEILRVLIALGAVASLAVWQVRSITKAKMPELRAIEAVGALVPLFIVFFAALYARLSQVPGAFSEALDRTGALYFSIVTLGTVGYGDIAPQSDLARLIVSAQILGDLVFLAALLRVVTAATQRGLGRSGKAEAAPPADETGEEPTTG